MLLLHIAILTHSPFHVLGIFCSTWCMVHILLSSTFSRVSSIYLIIVFRKTSKKKKKKTPNGSWYSTHSSWKWVYSRRSITKFQKGTSFDWGWEVVRSVQSCETVLKLFDHRWYGSLQTTRKLCMYSLEQQYIDTKVPTFDEKPRWKFSQWQAFH